MTPAPAQNFTGKAFVGTRIQLSAEARSGGAAVIFEPGARTNWHTHAEGQTLIITAGVGRVQLWGGPVQEVRLHDIVTIPPGAKHWHGAAPTASMAHVALSGQPTDAPSVQWLEPVTEQQYRGSSATNSVAGDTTPSRAQQLMGDIAPELAALTDDVLFGQVWADESLSQRDRSLVTVSALIAMDRPAQLRSHLSRARSNGLTEEELVAVITHLAFYAGWPSAVSAVGVAREVFEQN